MPAFAPNFTARVKLEYVCFGRHHTQQWRTPVAGALDASIGALIVEIGNYYADIQGGLSIDFAILSTTFARENSDIFLPSILGVTVAPAGGVPDPAAIKRASAQQLSFVGRTSGGNRGIVYQYGWVENLLGEPGGEVPDDFRINPGENATIDATIGDMNGVFTTFCGNDGLPLTWKLYANMKYNDNILKKIRKGA
jgi:hypothetical protein